MIIIIIRRGVERGGWGNAVTNNGGAKCDVSPWALVLLCGSVKLVAKLSLA